MVEQVEYFEHPIHNNMKKEHQNLKEYNLQLVGLPKNLIHRGESVKGCKVVHDDNQRAVKYLKLYSDLNI